jgi:hypothetical protein
MYIPLLLYIEQYLQTCISSIACTPWFSSSHLLYDVMTLQGHNLCDVHIGELWVQGEGQC